MSHEGQAVFRESRAYPSFSTNDLPATRAFYAGILGLDVTEGDGILHVHLPDGQRVVIEAAADHRPSGHAVLHFPVPDIDVAADHLLEAGIRFERYAGLQQDEWGILRPHTSDDGPPIAWFRDPAGNLIAVLEPTR
jgi:catechol 2,3-dioxygenase-like lactoylglutathione lyase family enzyme